MKEPGRPAEFRCAQGRQRSSVRDRETCERERDLNDSRWVRFNFKLKDRNYLLLKAISIKRTASA